MPPRRPHPFLDSATKSKGAATGPKKLVKSGGTRGRTAGTAIKSRSASNDDTNKVDDAGGKAKTKPSEKYEQISCVTPKGQQSTVDSTAPLKPKGQLRERAASNGGTGSASRVGHLKQKRSSEERRKEKEKDRVPVPVSMEWNHEYGAHARMFKQPKDQSAEHTAAATRLSGGQTTPSLKGAVVFRRAAGSAENSRSTKQYPSSSSASGVRDVSRPRSNSTPPDIHRAVSPSSARRTPGTPRRTSAAAPPRSMPRKWVEKPSNARGRKADKGKDSTQTEASVVRFGMFRGVFNLVGGLKGVRGLLLDEEFNMADSYLGNYTFKVKGPGMMGSYLTENGVPPDGERSFLAGGGDCVINMQSGKEYWVEVIPCNADEVVIKQKIDIVESEIARLTTVDAVARATTSVSPHSPGRRSHSAVSSHSASSGGSDLLSNLGSGDEGPDDASDKIYRSSADSPSTVDHDPIDDAVQAQEECSQEECSPLSMLAEEAGPFNHTEPSTPRVVIDDVCESPDKAVVQQPIVDDADEADEAARIKQEKRQALQMKLDERQAEIAEIQRQLNGE